MTLYAFFLFIHVVSAIGLFVGLTLEGFVSLHMRLAQDAEQLKFFVRSFNRLRWVFIPSFAGILVGGFYLASKYGRGTVWIPAALITTLAIMFIGGLITARKMRQLTKTLATTGVAFEAASARANDTLLALSYGLRCGLAVGVVFLMTGKPGLWASVIALVAGCAVGLFIPFGLGRISNRNGMGCGPWSRRCSQDVPTASTR
jgi:hypothetical protein